MAAVVPRSRRRRETHAAFDAATIEALGELVHEGPRARGYETSIWTFALLARACSDRKMTATRVTGETLRVTLARAGIRWRRATLWIVSSDPAYATQRHGRAPATLLPGRVLRLRRP